MLNRGAEHGLTQGAVLAVDQQGELVYDKSAGISVEEEGVRSTRCACPMNAPARSSCSRFLNTSATAWSSVPALPCASRIAFTTRNAFLFIQTR